MQVFMKKPPANAHDQHIDQERNCQSKKPLPVGGGSITAFDSAALGYAPCGKTFGTSIPSAVAKSC